MYLLSYIKECLRSLLSLKCISLIFVISRREITFEDVATFGGLLLSKGRYFRGGGGGCYFGKFMVLYKKLSQSGQYKNSECKHCFFLFFSPSPPPTYFFPFPVLM